MTLHAISADATLMPHGIVPDMALLHEKGEIVDIVSADEVPAKAQHQRAGEGVLVPGFFDTQVNGGGGCLFNDAPTIETLKTMSAAHQKYGTCALLPTLITDDLSKVKAAIEAVDLAIEVGVPGIMGIHLEGPFLNKAKKGIHDGDKIQALKTQHIDLLSSLKRGRTLLTLAPEETDPNLIEALVSRGVIVSAGHTNATCDQVQAGLHAGITGFTHLYNAMSPLNSRAPGAVGAALADDGSYVGLIPDGNHVHPAALRVAYKAKGADKCVIVTDAMSTIGSDQTEFLLNGEQILLSDGRLTNAAGVLAGSALDMISAVRYMAEEVGTGLVDACLMASRSPASFMRLDHLIGHFAPGKRASFLVVRPDYKVAAAHPATIGA